MPACTTESLTKLWNNNNNREYVRASLESSDSNSPHSQPSSPLSTSPKGTLRRSRSATPTSSDFFQDHFVIKSEWRSSQNMQQQKETKSLLVQIIGWYPCFLLQVIRAAIAILLPAACIRTIIALPSLWVSAWLWIFWKVFDIPLLILKWCLSVLYLPSLTMFRKRRTVLISGGSTIQSLHLARNFYSAGARVIVCEVNGLFSLARFSTAVSKFYTLPKPSADNQRAYIRALCEIVEKEGAVYYVPVNVTSPAIYDAAAKPVLELLGCTCFCPSVKDVLIFDDILEVFHRCVDNGIPTPPYFPISSTSKLALLYQNGTLRANKYIMSKCGPHGNNERKMVLPPNLHELRVPGEINENHPWVIVENQEGNVFVTCTTVKQNQVLANVTCQLDQDKSLKPIYHKEIEDWLQNFFSKMNLARPISGHFTFRIVITEPNNMILPISCKIGVSLPYICYTSVHPKVLLKPCKHFSRQSSGPLTTNKGRYWMHRALLDAVQKPSVESVTRLIGTVLDKREVLFVYWDPLPYFAYYHMQLPLRNVADFLNRRQMPNIATVPVQ